MVNPNQVMAAGLAAAAASIVTSRFGVAGTLLGAALTAMIITGGSAILKSYMESVSGRVRGMPTKLRSNRGQQRAGGYGGTMPGRPDLRDNFIGRMRAALDWFSHLPAFSRRSILIKGLLAAAVAFVICMGVLWGAEKVIGNSLSCGLWAKCPSGAVPGIHPAGYGGTGAGSSISGGSMNTGGARQAKGKASSTACARRGTRSETDGLSSGETTANPSSGETMADPSSGIQGPAGIRVAPRHRPPLTRAPCLERGARNPPRRVRDKNPSRRMQARNPFHRMQEENPPRRRLESRMHLPTPHRQPASNEL